MNEKSDVRTLSTPQFSMIIRASPRSVPYMIKIYYIICIKNKIIRGNFEGVGGYLDWAVPLLWMV